MKFNSFSFFFFLFIISLFLLFINGNETEKHSSSSDPEVLILFFCIGLLLGGFVNYILLRLHSNIPYTVVMFTVGVILAVIRDNLHLGNLSFSIADWKKLEPEMMLFLFLPVLVFGEAMTLKWHHLKGGFPQGLLLAGPGVIIGAFLMGIFVFYCLPFGWSWNFSMVFGAVSSATDTVAVVSVLKSAGASPKLTMAIISESLLNDGVAFVMFTLFFDMVKGDVFSVDEIIVYFIKMAVASPLFGCVIGLVFVFILRTVNNPLEHEDVTIQIAMSICCAYLTFYVSEHELHLSGLLACYGSGAMFSCFSHPLILNPESMHHVWGMIEWVGNTLLFLLAGIIIGSRTIHYISGDDVGYLLILFIILIIIRYFIVFLLYPLLSRVGLKCSFNDAIFIGWAGLRGALAMALALIVESETDAEEHLHKSETSRFFFFIGGLAALTLLINATTAQSVLEYLGLLKLDSPDKILVLEQIKKRMKYYLIKKTKYLSKHFNIPNPNKIKEYNTMLTNSEVFRNLSVGRHTEHRTNSNANNNNPRLSHHSLYRYSINSPMHDVRSFSRRNSASPLLDDLLCYVRTIYLNIVRVEYWKYVHEGKLPRKSYAIQALLYSIDYGLDNAHEKKLQDWVWIKEEVTESYLFKFFNTLTKCNLCNNKYIHYALDVVQSRNQEFMIYVLMSFIEGHKVAQKKIFRFMGEEDTEDDENLRIPELTVLLNESKEAIRQALKILSSVEESVISNIVCRQAGRTLLTYQIEYVINLVSEGLLSPADSEKFLHLAKEDLAHLEHRVRREFREHVKINQSKRISGANLEQLKLAHELPFTMSHLTERFLSTESPLFSLDVEKYVENKENNGSEVDGGSDGEDEEDDDNGDEADNADVDDQDDNDYDSAGSKLSGLQIDSGS